MFNETALKELQKIKEKYPTRRAALLPALYIAQKQFGWLSNDAMESVCRSLDLPKSVVRSVASFYSMYKHKPMGRHVIQLCTNVSCMVFGAETLVELLEKRFGVKPGGISPDGRFSLVIMECIGACDVAPAMLVNEDYHHSLNETNIISILEGYK